MCGMSLARESLDCAAGTLNPSSTGRYAIKLRSASYFSAGRFQEREQDV